MTYQITVIHPKAAALLQDLAELGLISIEGEINGFPVSEKRKKVPIAKSGVEKSDPAREEEFNFDDLPPITRSLAGSLKAPDALDYKKFKSDRLAKKYL